VVSISQPVDQTVLNTASVNVTGSIVEANLRSLTVNGIQAFVNGGAFEAENVPLIPTNPVVSISAGASHNLALQSDGTVTAWGINTSGQTNVPIGLAGILAVSAGGLHSLALKSDGTVVAWGQNGNGQATVPSGLSGLVAVSAGGSHSLALKGDGTVVAWGDNTYGQTTIPSGLGGVTSISAGSANHNLALKSDGTVVAWGADYYGQTDLPALLAGVTAISAGEGHSLALLSDGTVQGWGFNDFGQATPPAGLSGVAAISGGGIHSLALKSDGTVVAWGDNSRGQCNVPANLSGVVAVSAGGLFSLALKGDGTIVAWGDSTYGQTTVPSILNAIPITAVAEDFAGNITTAWIVVYRQPDTGGNLNVPVQLTATPVGGFAPLAVSFTVQANIPGTIQQVLYDWDGDGITDQAASNFNPISHTYTSAGQFFPVVTIVNNANQRFSSPGGWNSAHPSRLRINVQTAPVVLSTISVTDPIDLKWMPGGYLYVLSRSAKTIYEFDCNNNNSAVRSLSGISTTAPTGLDVDGSGNVYVALNGDNQVAKYNPTTSAFQLDTTFGTSGKIGRSDKGAGSGNGEFISPYDVAVTPDGTQVAVSDSGNNRIQRFTSSGAFLAFFGQQGSGVGQFSAPKGLTYDDAGYLYIVDAGNSRICLSLPPTFLGTSGIPGSQLGQFQSPLSLRVGMRGIYVADTGNNRVQAFEPMPTATGLARTPLVPRESLPSSLSLNLPSSTATVSNLLSEQIYIADTGNNRVILLNLPGDDPLVVWNSMVNRLVSGDLPGAIANFSAASADSYRQAFQSSGSSSAASAISQIGTLTPVFIRNDAAEYYFEQAVVPGQTVTFPVQFVRENGVWKIHEF
jgi:hypothetical protein